MKLRESFSALGRMLRPPTRLERRIAARYLRSRSSGVASLNTVISAGGVTVGVMALIVVLGVMNGLRNDLRERILVGAPHLRILTYGSGLRVDDWESAIARIRRDPEVLAAAPEVLTESIITNGADYATAVNVLGFEPDTGTMSVTTFPRSIVRGDLSFRPTRDGVDGAVLLGERLAARINAFPGDVISLVPPTAARVNRALGTMMPRFWQFEVVGLFDTGMFQYDNQFVVMSREVAQSFAGLGTAVSGIEVRVTDPERAPDVGRRLEQSLGYPYRALDWQAQNSSLFSALKLEKLAMGLIIFFIMVVAAFNIVGTLTMVVADKTREIGILRAMGLTGPAISRIFLLQGAIIGLVGTLLGLALGLAVAYLVDSSGLIRIDPQVYFIDHLPVDTEVTDILVVVVASVLVAIVATLYPSRAAARLEPVEAIRHE